MSLTTFERLIIGELYRITGERIRDKDLLEWRNTPLTAHDGERVVHCPDNGVWVSIPDSVKIKTTKPPPQERDA